MAHGAHGKDPKDPKGAKDPKDGDGSKRARVPSKVYEKELYRLQTELVKLQAWVSATNSRVAVLFEGRDAAGKGGTISRITQYLNPRVVRVAALPKPTEREQSQWYFQRYVEHLPAGGEIVLFDRSWYNRAGVEHVMGYCTPEQYQQFLRQTPIFERLLMDSGLTLVKYWFSVSDEEQERRFTERLTNPLKRWKLSPVDLASRQHWVEYSRAKDTMFVHTDTSESPWYVVESDDKRAARLNCISHLLSKVPYTDVWEDHPVADLPPRQEDQGYVRPDRTTERLVPNHAATLIR